MKNFSRIIIAITICFCATPSSLAADYLKNSDRAFVVKTALHLLKYIKRKEVNEIDYAKRRDSADSAIFDLLSDYNEPLQGHFRDNIAVIHGKIYVQITDRISDGNHTLTPFTDLLLRYLFSNFHLERFFVELLRPANSPEIATKNKRMAKALLYIVGYDVSIDDKLTSADIENLNNYMKRKVKFPDTVRNATGTVNPSLVYKGLSRKLYYIPDEYKGRDEDFVDEVIYKGNAYVKILNGYRDDRAELAALLLTIKPDTKKLNLPFSTHGRGLFSYPWRPASFSIKNKIFLQAPFAGKYKLNGSETNIDASSLPWYNNIQLIRVKNSKWTPENLYIYYLIDKEGKLYWLDGKSSPIHAINKKASLRINAKNVLDYTWYFMFFVRGNDGPFLVAETPEDTFVPNKNIDSKTKTIFKENLKPSLVHFRHVDGSFQVKATIFYSNAIFEANMLVKPDGMIEMKDDKLLAANLQVKIHAPIN